jgi:hypothetical protein
MTLALPDKDAIGVKNPENCMAGSEVRMPAAKMAATWVFTNVESSRPKGFVAIFL